LASGDIVEINRLLQEKVSQAPELFKNSLVLIDLHELTQQKAALELVTLIDLMRSLQLVPIAISGATSRQNAIAIELGIAIQSERSVNHAKNKVAVPVTAQASVPEIDAPLPQPIKRAVMVENKVITQPVRSGQRIYAKGDLTVLAPVSSSAELMAEGNIHVYAPLRGRALAGVQGNTDCRIFCSDLQAELVSVAGVYKLNEELDKQFKRKLVQIYLQDQTLLIAQL
jgi:septum site-determining protein MinC